jgi:hypothetical protein
MRVAQAWLARFYVLYLLTLLRLEWYVPPCIALLDGCDLF